MKLLHVDDDPQMTDLITSAFTEAGHQVITADSPVKGLQMFMENRDSIDCMITDYRMCKCEGMCERDGHNGIWLARQMKAWGFPKILLTGEKHFGLRASAYEAGIYVIMDKPCDIDELLRVAEELTKSPKRG